jgi:GDPmannose 4,6-dehydratase
MKALITGVSGQDGSHLADLLLEKGYEVHGLIRRSSTTNTQRIDHIINKIQLHLGDMTDSESLHRIIREIKPDEVYNLAAQSMVRDSFDVASYTADVDALGVLRILEAIMDTEEDIRFYQAGTSEMFGAVLEIPQTENTPFNPQSPYAISKTFGHYITKHYRDSYGLFACNGILFNHEGPRRGDKFVTQKIVKGLVAIKRGLQDKLYLGNLDSRRDWGLAADYIRAMYLMLQQDTPDDFVIATGETHTIREFLDEAARLLGMDWTEHVKVDSKLFRPSEVDMLLGCADKAKSILNWQPEVKFKQLVKIMVDAELAR